jgi:VanZ family protein
MILLMGPRLQKIGRASAWLLALAIVVLSLVPPSYRPITEASHNLEHLAIFLATGFAFGVAYPDRPFALAIGLVIFCGAIELAQRWVPGRHARLRDLIVDAVAVCIGLGVASVAARISGYIRRP